jgi:hypothetical protein
MKKTNTNTLTRILNFLTGTKPAKGGRPEKYPWTSTPVGGSFMMKNIYGANTYKKLRKLGLQYKQHKTARGILAIRVA